MGGRTMPDRCPHGRVLDWGDFGPDADGSVGTERCEQCEIRAQAKFRASAVQCVTAMARDDELVPEERRALLDALGHSPDCVAPDHYRKVWQEEHDRAEALLRETRDMEGHAWRYLRRNAQLRADNDRLRGALRKHGVHRGGSRPSPAPCAFVVGGGPCSCGLDAALSADADADAEPDHTDPACVIPHPHPGRSCDSRSMLDADAEPETCGVHDPRGIATPCERASGHVGCHRSRDAEGRLKAWADRAEPSRAGGFHHDYGCAHDPCECSGGPARAEGVPPCDCEPIRHGVGEEHQPDCAVRRWLAEGDEQLCAHESREESGGWAWCPDCRHGWPAEGGRPREADPQGPSIGTGDASVDGGGDDGRSRAIEALRAIAVHDWETLHRIGGDVWEGGDLYSTPADFDLEGDFESDARHVFPARHRAIVQAARAALEGGNGA